MNLNQRTLICLALAALAPGAAAQVAVGHLGRFDITSNGMIQGDANWYDSDTVDLTGGPDERGSAAYAVRRAQVYLKGRSAGRLGWVLGYDAKNGKWLDANLQYDFDKRQTLWVGKFKQPSGLERLSASRNNDFMSRSMLSDTFAVGRRIGIGYRYERSPGASGSDLGAGSAADGNWGVEVGYFGPAITTRRATSEAGYAVRGTWAPFDADGTILHLGLSYANYATSDDTVHLRARPNADLTPVWLVNTGDLVDTRRVATLGAESFWADGPFKLQGEYMTTRAARPAADSGDFRGHGGYVSALWNGTGQHWGYENGVPITQVAPRMWQLGVRFDTIDLNDGGVRGGWMRNWTVGVNLYWNARWKFVLNHVWARSKMGDTPDNPGITEARVQLVW
ncbi:OprO/OprP family phosphate-selective porin [Dokdonella sp.]|uniref:OprO/OprP family phosphate-selective porin n=1 Tax=Dokdonella sp. TaxID=2291710 RepID=UPI0031C32D3C|nr:OprO/OprP family phosphate-selective porin [Dokdonella sp.]